jgi:molybdate transport system ATP-binding protein
VSGSDGAILDVALVHRVHSGLVLDLSLRLGREIGVVFGPSGAGKTTLLRLIAGLTRGGKGHVRLGEETLFDESRGVDRPLRARHVGMIFQDDRLFPHLDVAANVRFGLKGWRREQAATRLKEVTQLCGVQDLLDRRPATLSGGERQRVGLARALAPRPRLLLCDEPVSALDLANRHVLLDRLRTVQRVEGIPMLYVTHSPAEAVSLGSQVFRMEAGRIVAEGPPIDVLSAAWSGSNSSIPWESVRNVFPAKVITHSTAHGATHLQIDDGPELIVPYLVAECGTRLLVDIRADDILLARGLVSGLSARNQISGTVERVVSRGPDAEVIVRTGRIRWIVSLVAPAIAQLELVPGSEVQLIIKARSCRVFGADSTMI